MLRRLRASDRAQSEEIERESFPTLFPPTSFRRELDNRRANYQVAFRPFADGEAAESPQTRHAPLAEALLRSARGLVKRERDSWAPDRQRPHRPYRPQVAGCSWAPGTWPAGERPHRHHMHPQVAPGAGGRRATADRRDRARRGARRGRGDSGGAPVQRRRQEPVQEVRVHGPGRP